MKVKRFNNLWAMGLILCGVLLVAFYVAKIFFPQFIVGVAEIPQIVKFGNYVDSHKWAYYLFTGITSYITMYFYACACCRIKKLNLLEHLSLFIITIISLIIQTRLVEHSLAYNFICYLLFPLIIALNRKLNDCKIFYSLCICFIFTTIAQSLSLSIRDISIFITYPNSATYFVLLIDLYIWNILLYNYYNFMEVKK